MYLREITRHSSYIMLMACDLHYSFMFCKQDSKGQHFSLTKHVWGNSHQLSGFEVLHTWLWKLKIEKRSQIWVWTELISHCKDFLGVNKLPYANYLNSVTLYSPDYMCTNWSDSWTIWSQQLQLDESSHRALL